MCGRSAIAVKVDSQRFIDLVLSHGQRLHRLGWNRNEPQLCLAWDRSDTRAERAFGGYRVQDPLWEAATLNGRYAMKPLVTHWHADCGELMRMLAIAFAYPADNPAGQYILDRLTSFMRHPGIVGFAFFTEGLMLSGDPQTLIDRIDAGATATELESEGTAVLARGATAVDLDHTTTWVCRIDGGAPEVMNRDPHHFISGTIPRALGLIVDAIRGTVPPRHELPVRYPTVNDLYEPTGSPLHEGS